MDKPSAATAWEEAIASKLTSLGAPVERKAGTNGLEMDFLVPSSTAHIVVEAKAWQASTESLQRGIAQAEYCSTLPGVRKAFVVVPSVRRIRVPAS